jgi:aspartokinase
VLSHPKSMVNVSTIVRQILEKRPIIQAALIQNIINYANLAENLKPSIEKNLGEEVKETAIIMALRRYQEKLSQKEHIDPKFEFYSEIILKSGLCDVAFVKSPSLLKSLRKIYELVDFDKGDTLNIIQGNYEINIVMSEKYLKDTLDLLSDEKKLNVDKNLVSLAMGFSKDFFYTPGILAKATRKLHWHNINVYENISTLTELIFIVNKKDATRAYNALMEIVDCND